MKTTTGRARRKLKCQYEIALIFIHLRCCPAHRTIFIDLDPTGDSHHSRIRTRKASVRYFLAVYISALLSDDQRPPRDFPVCSRPSRRNESRARICGIYLAHYDGVVELCRGNLSCFIRIHFNLHISSFFFEFIHETAVGGQRKHINSHCAAEIFIATAQSGMFRVVV